MYIKSYEFKKAEEPAALLQALQPGGLYQIFL